MGKKPESSGGVRQQGRLEKLLEDYTWSCELSNRRLVVPIQFYIPLQMWNKWVGHLNYEVSQME